MNFKPTLLKIIVSIIVAIIGFIYLAGFVICYGKIDSCNYLNESFWLVILFVGFYVVYSLFQRKKVIMPSPTLINSWQGA
ncbi:Uncharacterised protein [uncultured archaeon]|nr:Uncharacterised protein [uncultured archaeon]